jgi:hypothetical protein
LLFPQAGLELHPPILSFPQLLEWQAHAILPIFFPLRVGKANFFAQAGLEPQSSQSQPPRYLGL